MEIYNSTSSAEYDGMAAGKQKEKELRRQSHKYDKDGGGSEKKGEREEGKEGFAKLHLLNWRMNANIPRHPILSYSPHPTGNIILHIIAYYVLSMNSGIEYKVAELSMVSIPQGVAGGTRI